MKLGMCNNWENETEDWEKEEQEIREKKMTGEKWVLEKKVNWERELTKF